MNSIAHIRESDQQEQTVETHLLEVRALAEGYGAKLGVPHLTGLAGMLHDMGKYSDKFRNYILNAVSGNVPVRRGEVDHSTAGGKLLYEFFHSGTTTKYKVLAEVVGNAIISHHSYLQHFLNPELKSPYLKRVRQDQLEGYETSKQAFFTHVINEQEFHQYVDRAAAELEQFMKKIRQVARN